jgi:excisionase family DNA binding protein
VITAKTSSSFHIEKLAVDTREAARLLSVSPRTIQNYIAAKLLPARKLGRRTVISVRALKNFLRTDQPSPISKASGNNDGQ